MSLACLPHPPSPGPREPRIYHLAALLLPGVAPHVEARLIETHAETHRVLSGACEVYAWIGPDAAVLVRRDRAGLPENAAVTDLLRGRVVSCSLPARGPALVVGIDPRTSSITGLPAALAERIFTAEAQRTQRDALGSAPQDSGPRTQDASEGGAT